MRFCKLHGSVTNKQFKQWCREKKTSKECKEDNRKDCSNNLCHGGFH